MMHNAKATNKATTTTTNSARVVLVVDIHSQLNSSLEVAVAMASARRTGVLGMCVDDPDLKQTAGLPFSQEVMLLGGRTRSLEHRQLRRSMETFQAHFKSLLAEQADRQSIPWSVSTVSGQRQVLESSERRTSDLVIVGKPAHSARASRHAPARILLLAHDYASVLPILKLLLNLKANRRTEVLLLSEGQSQSDASMRLQQQLEDAQNTVVRPITPLQASQFCGASSSPLQYVLAADDANPETLGRIMRYASCPVILVS